MEKNNKSNFSLDQRLRTIKDTVDKMCWDYYNFPKTVTKSAEEILAEETALMEKIYTEVSDAQRSVEELSTLLENSHQFCDDMEIQIQQAYNICGLEIPNVYELLGEAFEREEETAEYEEIEAENKENSINEDSDSMGILDRMTFYEPTPAKPKTSAKKLF